LLKSNIFTPPLSTMIIKSYSSHSFTLRKKLLILVSFSPLHLAQLQLYSCLFLISTLLNAKACSCLFLSSSLLKSNIITPPLSTLNKPMLIKSYSSYSFLFYSLFYSLLFLRFYALMLLSLRLLCSLQVTLGLGLLGWQRGDSPWFS